jgi:hypothetical protein
MLEGAVLQGRVPGYGGPNGSVNLINLEHEPLGVCISPISVIL